MSKPLRIALVAEGPTDCVVLGCALTSILGGRRFILRRLQPEDSLAFGPTGSGWGGVHRWSRKVVNRSRALRDDPLFSTHDILILHLDADVAGAHYSQANIEETHSDLPCAQPCPPSSATTNPLRKVLLRWVGEREVPPKLVLCTPSKSMEAWVVAALFPKDLAVRKGIECWPNPEARLAQQPRNQRIQKTEGNYQKRAPGIEAAWPRLASTLDEAKRFQEEFEMVLAHGA